jgi:hypothetical protein
MECKTWEEQRDVECCFRVLADLPKVKMSRIHPLQQEAVKRIHDATSISLLKKAKKICYNKWGVSPIIIHKTEVAYDTDM